VQKWNSRPVFVTTLIPSSACSNEGTSSFNGLNRFEITIPSNTITTDTNVEVVKPDCVIGEVLKAEVLILE